MFLTLENPKHAETMSGIKCLSLNKLFNLCTEDNSQREYESMFVAYTTDWLFSHISRKVTHKLKVTVGPGAYNIWK